MIRRIAPLRLGTALAGLALAACVHEEIGRSATGTAGSATLEGRPAPAVAAAPRRHVVQPGETLSQLAERYGLGLSVLGAANGMRPPYRVRVGQVLTLPDRPTPAAAASSVTVRPGDTLAGIAARQGLKLSDLAGANPGLDPDRLRPGQRVRLPGEVAMPPAPPMSAEEIELVRQASQTKPPSLSGEGFLWPVRGRIIVPFGERPDGTRNDGVNIAAPSGTSVVAAENGVVVYAGSRLPGYGETLLIRHAGGFTTAYAHNSQLLVRVGDRVARGQRVAVLGTSRNIDQAQLHFELRLGRTPIDPSRHIEGAAAPAKVASAG